MTRAAERRASGGVWNGLLRVGSAAALGAALLLLVEIALFAAYPLPETAAGYFALFERSRLLGLVESYLLETAAYILYVPLFLALYVTLRPHGESAMAVSLALGGIGIAVFLATNNPFALLSLADRYAAAGSEADRAQLLAAGQALLANTNQRAAGGFNMGLFLVSLAGLIASAVMLRSGLFSRAAAYVGLLANALSLADYVRLILAPDARLLILLLALASGLLLLAWYVLIARSLWRLGS